MKRSLGRAAALALVSMGALAAPTPAFADLEQLGECLRNCRQLDATGLYGPGFMQMCTNECLELYDDGSRLVPQPEGPWAVIRYN